MAAQSVLLCSQNREVALYTLRVPPKLYPSHFPPLFLSHCHDSGPFKPSRPTHSLLPNTVPLSLPPLTSFIHFHLHGLKFLVHTPAFISASGLFLIMCPLHIELQPFSMICGSYYFCWPSKPTDPLRRRLLL